MDERSHALLTLAMDLPEAARAEIAAALLDSIEPEADADVEQAWRDEVARRMAAMSAGTVSTVPWSTVRDEVFDRLKKHRAG
jgi:putative addiction module component (TIGR02574 family)